MNQNEYCTWFPGETAPVLIVSEPNIRYTVGFGTTARRPYQIGYTAALLTPAERVLFCPKNWQEEAQAQVDPGVKVMAYQGGLRALVEGILPLLQDRRLGVEVDDMPLAFYLLLREKLPTGLEWFDVSETLSRARLVKRPEELEALRRAAAVACAAMEYAREILRPGMTERQAVAALEYHMRKNGSDGVPYTIKVLAGEHALRTHNLPGERRIERGDIVLLDIGARVDGYASDWSRSFAIGQASEKQRELYRIVMEIERACIAQMRPGTRLSDLLHLANSMLERHVFAPYFNPFLGHSIGITSQERPTIVPGESFILEENMVFCVEPGIYVPGVGGVRIEDEVRVTHEGPELLTGLLQEEFLLID